MTHTPASRVEATDALAPWLARHRAVFVLTGAGISTASGIPDYRDAAGAWKRQPPITYQSFVGDPVLRARYWARSFVGWPLIDRAKPTAVHHALAALAASGRVSALVTQNVDGLHAHAGHVAAIDLHGRLDAVVCLDCTIRIPRAQVQASLAATHPHWSRVTAAIAPDGDADLDAIDLADFASPPCPRCAGMLKPDVVFFGENVPRERVDAAHAALLASDAMLVVGSSLMVYSGYRFARRAREAGLPLAILTRGVTRADEIATLKLDADCESVLPAAVAEVMAAASA